MGLYKAGFEVVGVDIKPQPNYPFEFICADAMSFRLDRAVHLIWASPPCQAYSNAQRIRDNKHPDLIGRIRERLIRSGKLYCIENVPGAPLINPITLCGTMFCLRTYRHRLFECNFPVHQPPHPEHTAKTAKMGRPVKPDEFMHIVGHFSGVREARRIMDMRWASRDELSQAIPPAFACHIGKAAAACLQAEAA